MGETTLEIEAPFGYYIVRYDVVPRSSMPDSGRPVFGVGGKGVSGDPFGLFDSRITHSTSFPPEGIVTDIPVETHAKISTRLNLAATAEIPEDQRIPERCGTYLLLTKDPATYNRLDSMVAEWTIEDGDEYQAPTIPESPTPRSPIPDLRPPTP